jgi:hypothetical protein
MKVVNLLVKIKFRGESRYRSRVASRIKVDAKGRLILVNTEGEVTETICMTDVESISIHSTTRGEKAA